MNRVNHLVIVEALGGRQFHLPSRFKTRAHFGVVHRLVAGQNYPDAAP